MNEITSRRQQVRTTQAAEGQPRWRWTTAELLRLADLGAFDGEDQFELIGGEIVPMSPNARRHEVLREELEQLLRRLAFSEFKIVGEPQLNLTDDTYTKPDLLVRPAGVRTPDVRGETALLVIEVADSRLTYDLGTKAALYATHGVRDYWVIDARQMVTKVHRQPSDTGYSYIREVEGTDTLVPLLAPALPVRLADLDLD